jgi:hypothetical protein
MRNDDIERDARDMIDRFGDVATHLARVRAKIAGDQIDNQRLAQTWRDVADAIDRLCPEPE